MGRRYAKYAFACVSAEHLGKDENLNVAPGEEVLVASFGWLWKNEESEQYWNAFVSGTNGECETDYNGEKVRVKKFKTAPKMVYFIPGKNKGYVVSGIRNEDFGKYGFNRAYVYYAGKDFATAERVYKALDKDKFYMLDLLASDEKLAVESTRRHIYGQA